MVCLRYNVMPVTHCIPVTWMWIFDFVIPVRPTGKRFRARGCRSADSRTSVVTSSLNSTLTSPQSWYHSRRNSFDERWRRTEFVIPNYVKRCACGSAPCCAVTYQSDPTRLQEETLCTCWSLGGATENGTRRLLFMTIFINEFYCRHV